MYFELQWYAPYNLSSRQLSFSPSIYWKPWSGLRGFKNIIPYRNKVQQFKLKFKLCNLKTVIKRCVITFFLLLLEYDYYYVSEYINRDRSTIYDLMYMMNRNYIQKNINNFIAILIKKKHLCQLRKPGVHDVKLV